MLVEQLRRNVAQGADRRIPFLKISDGFFAFLAASIVGARGMIVLGHGVADHELDASWNGN